MRNHTFASGNGCSQPSETSPLLGDTENSKPPSGEYVVEHHDEEAVGHNGIDAAREAQFTGPPDAQKKLKYIVPAISIGVYTCDSLSSFPFPSNMFSKFSSQPKR